jgi:hypothetical protein
MFLGSLWAGIAVLSLPEISPVLRLLNPYIGQNEDFNDMIHRLLFGEGATGPFVARAEANTLLYPPQPFLPANTALLKMLDVHGFNRRFLSSVDNDEADQCTEQFERQEDDWRKKGFDAFTKVHRSTVDNHVAFGIGGNIDRDSNLVDAAGASQYGDKAAVPLEKHDPVTLIASRWIHQRNLSPQELTQALAPIEKKNTILNNNQVATRYETPVSTVVYIPQPRPGSGLRNAVGVVASSLKKSPNTIHIADFFA